MNWKISAADRKVIRSYAAKAARRRPGQIIIEVGERFCLDEGPWVCSFNILMIDKTEDWDDSDLNQTWRFSEVKEIELTPDGKALVDFYIYEREFDDHGDLNTNVQAHVKLIDGKPRIWKMTDTDYGDLILFA
jgi:hypothetical protein